MIMFDIAEINANIGHAKYFLSKMYGVIQNRDVLIALLLHYAWYSFQSYLRGNKTKN